MYVFDHHQQLGRRRPVRSGRRARIGVGPLVGGVGRLRLTPLTLLLGFGLLGPVAVALGEARSAHVGSIWSLGVKFTRSILSGAGVGGAASARSRWIEHRRPVRPYR